MNGVADAGYGDERPLPRSSLPPVAAVAVAILAALLVWLLAVDDDLSSVARKGGTGAASIPTAQPVAASTEQLEALARAANYPVYWLGPGRGQKHEVTRLADGRVFIRYLPPNVKPGSPSLDFDFVATYPDRNAFRSVRRASRQRGAITRTLRGGGIAVANERGREIVRATARRLPVPPVFFAEPDSEVLVEVYDPVSAERAFREVETRRVRPIR